MCGVKTYSQHQEVEHFDKLVSSFVTTEKTKKFQQNKL